jgi:hypothetical protein
MSYDEAKTDQLASRISMGLTIAQLSARLRCVECGGQLHSVKPWRPTITVPFAGSSVRGADTNVRSYSMKTFVSAFALALALAFTGPAFAQDDVTKATDKASCEKAGGMWDDTAKKCSKKM